jgi:hypothetical protein
MSQFLSVIEGVPHLVSEMWVSAPTDSLRVAIHHDSISTTPLSPVR